MRSGRNTGCSAKRRAWNVSEARSPQRRVSKYFREPSNATVSKVYPLKQQPRIKTDPGSVPYWETKKPSQVPRIHVRQHTAKGRVSGSPITIAANYVRPRRRIKELRQNAL